MAARRFVWLLVSIICWVAPAYANDQNPELLAKQHFDRGLALSDARDFDRAIEEFERAYALKSHPAVLFNLGQALSAVGRSVEAVRALRGYLESSPSVDPKRRLQVQELIEQNQRRIGRLELSTEPTNAEISVDGRSLGRGPFTEPLELGAGTHGLVANAAGHETLTRQIVIAPSKPLSLRLTLVPKPMSPGGAVGWLVILCPVPGASVAIDGVERAKTPLEEPLLAEQGQRRVTFERSGYGQAVSTVLVPDGRAAHVRCELRPDGQTPAEQLARLRVRATESDARILVDGRRYQGEPLPSGPHAVTIERAGFQTWRAKVHLEPGQDKLVEAKLSPTEDYRSSYSARATRQRNWALGTGAAGLVVAGTGLATYLWNGSRYEDWQAERDNISASLAEDGLSQELLERHNQLQEDGAAIERVDTIAIGLGAFGAGLMVLGGVLWFQAPDPDRYSSNVRVLVGSDEVRLKLDW